MYKITISDGTILKESIEHVSFSTETTNDYNSRHTNPRNSMIITGKIDTDEKTAGLYKWALLPGSNPECYKEITVEQYQKELLVRKVSFNKAFVVDYSENYSNSTGVGTFTLYIRQFFAKDIEVTSKESNKETNNTVINKVEEPVKIIQNKIAMMENIPKVESAKKTTMSFTDRLAKQSEQDLSGLSDDKLKEIFAKEIEQSKEAYTRATDIIKTKKLKGCVASNGKITLSGFDGKTTKAPKDFTRVSLDTMFDYCKEIGHELPAKMPDFYDNGIKGSFFACHAEKQLSLLTDKPIGISKPMCPNCVEYFSKHAIHTKQVKITTDPKKTRIFFPNGVIREI